MTMRELGRAAVLALMFAVPLATAAHADQHGPLDRQGLRREMHDCDVGCTAAAEAGQNAAIRHSAAGKPSNVPADIARANQSNGAPPYTRAAGPGALEPNSKVADPTRGIMNRDEYEHSLSYPPG